MENSRIARLRARRRTSRYRALGTLLLAAGLTAGLLTVDAAYGQMTQEESLLLGTVFDVFAFLKDWISGKMEDAFLASLVLPAPAI